MALDSRRSFWGLTAAQFLGAFNDSCFKGVLIFYTLDQLGQDSVATTIWATAVFIAPFIFFSTYAGRLADRFSKRSVIVSIKLLEVAVMLVATLGFALHNVYFLIVVLVFMAIQSALFSPAKYGVLPEISPPDRLPKANGIIELSTFLAIIFGAVTSAFFYTYFKERVDILWVMGTIFVGIAVAGFLASLAIVRLDAAAPDPKLQITRLTEIVSACRAIVPDRTIRYAVLGIAYFWGLAILLDLALFFYGLELEFGEDGTGYMRGIVGVGIGVGSLLAGYLSNKRPELGLVPLGSLGMGLLATLLYFEPSFTLVLAALGCLGVAGGFFIVPLNVLLQQEAPSDQKGRVIAGSNLASFTAMLGAMGILYVLMVQLDLSASHVFLVVGLLTIAATVYVFTLVPFAFFRFLLWVAVHTLYRVKVVGRDNLPLKGSALLVANHITWVDGLLLFASTHRFVRFVVWSGFMKNPLLRYLGGIFRVIPIASDDGPRAIVKSLREASKSLEDGDLVGIFAEGQLTRTGQLLPFRGGVERILKGSSAPVVPVYIDRVWGSIFSFKGGKFFWKLPSRIPYPVTISIGEPIPPTTPATEIRQVVQELGSEAFLERREDQLPLPWTLVKYFRRHPFSRVVADSTDVSLTRCKFLVGVTAMARRLGRTFADEPMIGIFVPPSVGTAVANVAASLLGKPVVNFNYTIGEEASRSAASQCGITKILTSRQFIEKFPVEVPGEPIFLEDLRKEIGAGERFAAALAGWFLPRGLLRRYVGGRPTTVDDVATVIFSSGSTGEPKGVELSHFNLLSNLQAISQAFNLRTDDTLLGILPFFHSTGYTVTFWTPLLAGMDVIYHPNPLDARTVGSLARTYACTVLAATPTFLQGYTRRCKPEDFAKLRYVVVGAEKLSDVVREGFTKKFGLEPLEGYGATECSPLVSVNVPDYKDDEVVQVGSKTGIGHPLPGVSVRIVDPDSFEPMPVGEQGLLLVKGPNVMRGYLGKPELTRESIRDGWYVTGDIARMDEEGFLTLTDRLARFAKIAGEMVPHLRVEEELCNLAGDCDGEKPLVVTSVPDSKKGERLAVVHSLDDDRLQDLIQRLPESGLPNLWIPRTDSFVHAESIPVLGTGKVDLRAVKQIALEGLGVGAS